MPAPTGGARGGKRRPVGPEPRGNRCFHTMAEYAELVPQESRAEGAETVRLELAALIAHALNLDIRPADIDPDKPLYGEGLGLDSIDILEIALVISREYGIELKADSGENQVIFSSLRALSDFVVAKRTK